MIDKEEREDWKDGRVTWVSSTKLPTRDGAGKIIGIMGISRDITERKQFEARLFQSRRWKPSESWRAGSRTNQQHHDRDHRPE